MTDLPVTLTEVFEVVDAFRAAARILARNLRTPTLTRREQLEAIVALTQKAWTETELPEIIQGAIAAVKAARFPQTKTLDDFDFSFQRSIKRQTWPIWRSSTSSPSERT